MGVAQHGAEGEDRLVLRHFGLEAGELPVADLVLLGGNFSEPTTSGLVATPAPLTRARRADGGYRITGRKAFASMIAAADYVMVMAYPDEATSPTAAMLLLVPPDAPGRRVDNVWDTLGMRATRSDSMVLEDCWVPEEALLYRSDDIVPFRRDGANWFWASYTPVYLGIGVAAYHAIVDNVKARTPPGFAQPLAYHPDVRRHVAEMNADLEAARLLTLHSAWLSDTEGPTPATLAALYRAKFAVGEAVTRVTRTAMTLGGAHALFKTLPLERYFRDGAVAPVQFPPRDFCLTTLGMLALGLDPRDVLPRSGATARTPAPPCADRPRRRTDASPRPLRADAHGLASSCGGPLQRRRQQLEDLVPVLRHDLGRRGGEQP